MVKKGSMAYYVKFPSSPNMNFKTPYLWCWDTKYSAEMSEKSWGAWVAQSVKHLTLDLGSGHDLTACETEPLPPIWLCADGRKPAWDSLTFSAPLLLTFMCMLARSRSLSLSLSLSK